MSEKTAKIRVTLSIQYSIDDGVISERTANSRIISEFLKLPFLSEKETPIKVISVDLEGVDLISF